MNTSDATSTPHTKAHNVLTLYDHPPHDGRVICVDEFGPLRLRPRKGPAWQRSVPPPHPRGRRPRRHGVMYMLAALDLTTGRIHYRIRRRQRHHELLDLLRSLRARWPRQRLHLVLDNYASHHHLAVREWAEDNNAELVFLPTYSSWLNWIEVEFIALRHLALSGTDHHSHAEQNAAIAVYIRRRNTHARPKTGFDTDSPLRTWFHNPPRR
ncbi:IS630 family transposase [Actinosynnema sp. CA-299493]